VLSGIFRDVLGKTPSSVAKEALTKRYSQQYFMQIWGKHSALWAIGNRGCSFKQAKFSSLYCQSLHVICRL